MLGMIHTSAALLYSVAHLWFRLAIQVPIKVHKKNTTSQLSYVFTISLLIFKRESFIIK